jgi:hypothetical protein
MFLGSLFVLLDDAESRGLLLFKSSLAIVDILTVPGSCFMMKRRRVLLALLLLILVAVVPGGSLVESTKIRKLLWREDVHGTYSSILLVLLTWVSPCS